jgi:hypothetical protein
VLGIEILRQALEIRRGLKDALSQGAILAQMANMLIGLRKNAEAVRCSRDAIAILETFSPGHELAQAYHIQAGLDLHGLQARLPPPGKKPDAGGCRRAQDSHCAVLRQPGLYFKRAAPVLPGGRLFEFGPRGRGAGILPQARSSIDPCALVPEHGADRSGAKACLRSTIPSEYPIYTDRNPDKWRLPPDV